MRPVLVPCTAQQVGTLQQRSQLGCCAVAKRACFSSARWKPGEASPIPLPDQWPQEKTRFVPFPTLQDVGSAVSLGGTVQLSPWDRFLCGDQEFIIDLLCWSTSV